jgi:DNA primase
MPLPPEFIERVKEATDIVAVVSDHVQLKKTGRTWKARCPFHQEKTPSFHVNPDRQIFKCFGCGEGGDVFRFLQEFEKLSFPEAVEVLAGRAGIPMPQRSWAPAEEQSVYPALAWAEALYHKELSGRGGGPAREYLKRRGLFQETIDAFGLGWAPPGWETLLGAARGTYSAALLQRAGLIVPNDRGGHYDRFRGRVTIPIRSALGRTVGFGARGLGSEEPKYLNSPETEVFNKSRILYGLSEAKEALKARDEALVVEGYMDSLALVQVGMTNVVASCGTAFTEDQARILRRYVERAVLVFDGDTAGLRAAWKSAGVFLGAGLAVRIVALPEGHDPDSFVQANGVSALRALVEGAPGVVGFAQEALLGKLEKREDLVKALAYLGSRIDDPIRRRLLIQEAAERFRFSEELLAREARRLATGSRGKASGAATPKRPAPGHQDVPGRVYVAGLLAGEVETGGPPIPETALREPEIRALYARWRTLHDAGERDIQRRLLEDDATRALAAEILAEDTEPGAFGDAAARLRERARADAKKEITAAIQEAESQGDRERAQELLREKLHSLKETRP